eukprot:TRINITY_DN2435_c0_g1_i1.p1 TRINITY_DN2435_c0_g1~~TRINITY_DN2435_c0_g1_i1.p1  ORF type:complete len:240 (-),score=16.29 TRINITY_DN2435_c0_g1_i1:50-769(-)
MSAPFISMMILSLVALSTGSVLLTPANSTARIIPTPFHKIFGSYPFDVVANVTVFKGPGCKAEEFTAPLFPQGNIAILTSRGGCENSIKATLARNAGSAGVIFIETNSNIGIGHAGKTANLRPLTSCQCDNSPIGYILERDLKLVTDTIASYGFAELRFTSDSNVWLEYFNSGGFWFIYIFSNLVNLGAVIAALVRLRQFQVGSGSIFLLTVPHVSIWIELLASLGVFKTQWRMNSRRI